MPLAVMHSLLATYEPDPVLCMRIHDPLLCDACMNNFIQHCFCTTNDKAGATGRAGRAVALHSKNDIVPLTKTFVIYVAGPYKLYSNNYTTDIIITAILGSAMGHKTRKCCDCVVRWSEVWTWLHRCNSHNKGLC